MKRIVFDIETLGEDFEALDDFSKGYFLKYADTQKKEAEVKDSLSFYPLTAQIIAIGMLEVESDRGVVYFQNGNNERPENFKEQGIYYISCCEEEMLRYFWKHISRYEQFITFNGRIFDCPFVMLRSAVRRVRTTKNLMPYRYAYNVHIDLADQMSFYDAMRRRFNLHMWCKAFGIESPKEGGVTGVEIQNLYSKGEYKRIAQYCMRDVMATRMLFRYWENYLKF